MSAGHRTAYGIVALCLLLWLGQAAAVEHPYLHDAGDHCALCPLGAQGGHALPAQAPALPPPGAAPALRPAASGLPPLAMPHGRRARAPPVRL